jgi:imidazolonepropionase-like amidohydrolase
LVSALLLPLPAGLAAEPTPLVFTHVTVIDATGRPPLPNRTVIVAGNRIQAIGETGRLRTPRGAKVVAASGKFMIPGLWDMHVHFRGGAALIPGNESWLSLFVANGITGVREMGGDIAPSVFQWRAEIASGARFGPRILTSGPKVDGPSPFWEGSFAVTDAQSARDAVRKLKSMGADFVKIYAPGFPRETFSALMDEAKQQNLSVAGHLPLDTHTVRESIDAGVKCIEHLDYYVLPGCSRSEQQIRDKYAGLESLFRQAETFDSDWARDLIARMVQHGVWVTPTLAAAPLTQTAGHIDYDRDPRRRYIFPGIWRTWDPKSGGRAAFPEADQKLWERIREQSKVLLKMLQAGGVGLLAGSDSGASNNFTFPGWTLHRELELMVESGLTPMQALQTATYNPARYLGELDRAGTVEAGKAADLVLLNANPLTDIRNIEETEAVVLTGKLLTRADLDKLLDDVAKAAASAGTP